MTKINLVSWSVQEAARVEPQWHLIFGTAFLLGLVVVLASLALARRGQLWNDQHNDEFLARRNLRVVQDDDDRGSWRVCVIIGAVFAVLIGFVCVMFGTGLRQP